MRARLLRPVSFSSPRRAPTAPGSDSTPRSMLPTVPGAGCAAPARCGQAARRAACSPAPAGRSSTGCRPVLDPTRLDQLLGRDRRRRLAFACARRSAAPARPSRRPAAPRRLERDAPSSPSIDALHGLEVVEHPERALDHVVLDVALVRDADVVADLADHQAVAADEPEQRQRASGTSCAPSWLLIRMISLASGLVSTCAGVAHADHVLGELGLAFDAALALRDHERLEAFLAQAAQDLDGRDVGVALGAAACLPAAKIDGAARRIWSSQSGESLRMTWVLRAKRVASWDMV